MKRAERQREGEGQVRGSVGVRAADMVGEGTDVVRAHGVNFLDLLAEGDGLVDDELEEFVWRRFPGKELELLVNGGSPRDYDEERDLGAQEIGSSPGPRTRSDIRLTSMAPRGSRSSVFSRERQKRDSPLQEKNREMTYTK